MLKLLDLTGKVLTGDALMCQKAVAATIVDRGGDYVLPVKDNQKNLKADIMTAFETPVFPLSSYTEPATKAHGRIEQRSIDVLPAAALGPLLEEWPSVRQIARVTRKREVKRKGVWVATDETAWLITSLSSAQTSAAALLAFNRNHWSIENQLHRNKDVTLDEDKATNRKDNAPATSSPSRLSSSRSAPNWVSRQLSPSKHSRTTKMPPSPSSAAGFIESP